MLKARALRCKKIVSQLLVFAHQESFSFESIDVNHVIENSLDLVGFQLESGNINVIKKFQEGPLPVFGSTQQLEQVFINLLNKRKRRDE